MKARAFNSLSYTSLSTYRRCRQQYYWKYVTGYETRSSTGQQRGTAGHAALGVWHREYNRKLAMEAAWHSWTEAGHEDGDDWEQLAAALARYFIYSKQNDDFKLVEAEKEFKIEYTVPWRDTPIYLIGYIDGIVLDHKQHWVLENKFWKRVEKERLVDSDPQVSMYMLACSIMGYSVYGTLYNIIRVGTKIAETEPVIRRRLHRNPAGLPRLEAEMLAQAQEMETFHLNRGPVYRNFTKDCSWDCPFYGPCTSMLDDGLEPTEQLAHLADPYREVEFESDL